MESSADGRVVWITGAGSGIGRATAIEAAEAGWRVALTGRREDALESTADAVREAGGTALVLPGDASSDSVVRASLDRIAATWGRLDALVLAAGLNAPERRWADHDLATFDEIVRVNLTGPAHLVTSALPLLRDSRGVVVFVSSYSAWAFSPVAGVAYSASKAGLAALSRTLNAQEAAAGVRSCHLCPGDVNTDFLGHRPRVPSDDARAVMMQPSDVARSIRFVLEAPAHVRFDELVVSPVSQT